MSIASNLLDKLAALREARGWSESQVGIFVVNDHKMIRRVRDGRVTLRTLASIEQFLADPDGYIAAQEAERRARRAA
jgi:hypothetical protein